MKNNTSLFQKLIFFTGLLDFPIGIWLIANALIAPDPESLTVNMALGAFIIFAGARLIWASQDIDARAPLIVWNALSRCIAFIGVIYTSTIGASSTAFLIIGSMDLILSFIYIIGCVKTTGVPFRKLVLGKV